ncbi:MAG TPA: hypothetical protein VK636_09395 [Gemmatimonadaceae bacterium]|nr:hypothetical protein [Gemmatimonadaceae bacterium]
MRTPAERMSAAPRTERALRLGVALAAAAGLLASGAPKARAQGGVLLQGIADLEAWSTNTTSNLLTRNAGKPGVVGRVQLTGAYEFARGWVVYAQGEAVGGDARAKSESEHFSSDHFGLRYAPSRALVFDGGRLTPVLGTFSPRHYSTRNPLIGSPDGYALKYPLGVEVSGETKYFDYRAAMVSLPSAHMDYVPAATPRLRPAVGGGITPIVGLRLGGSYTVGPYLNNSYSYASLGGKEWTDYHQRVAAFDFAYSRGYLETHAEFARGSYDVPGTVKPISGSTYYGEIKYTLTPRFFVAVRSERNDYPSIRPTGTAWTARLTDFADGEVGGGFRLTPSTLVKASVRADRYWFRYGVTGFPGTGGHAIALQLSQAFDVVSWFDRDK